MEWKGQVFLLIMLIILSNAVLLKLWYKHRWWYFGFIWCYLENDFDISCWKGRYAEIKSDTLWMSTNRQKDVLLQKEIDKGDLFLIVKINLEDDQWQ